MAVSTMIAALAAAVSTTTAAAPKVILISLDGARPDLVNTYLNAGVINPRTGLGILRSKGSTATRNVPATPSVTAVNHIAIATGSTAVNNDIPANTFHPVAGTVTASVSGFGAAIGGYRIFPSVGPNPAPTAEPLWVRLRANGKTVVTATWPGGDGANSTVGTTVTQDGSGPFRKVDYTVPFGAFGGLGAQGFALTAASFTPAGTTLADLFAAAGRTSFSPVKVTSSVVETIYCAPSGTGNCGSTTASGRSVQYDIAIAALDTTNDGSINYDTLVFFDARVGILAGPFALPATGPAYVKFGGPSGRFYFEGSANRIGAAFFVSALAPDLSIVRFGRYSASFVPRNQPVIATVDDVNNNVGFWAPSPDFRIPERISPGFAGFPDLELERMYEDQVKTFVAYQTSLGLRAIRQNPNADLVMIYIEQPDGSGHQFTLTNPLQPTDFTDPNSILAGQDAAKIARYAGYLEFAYQQANNAVQAIIKAVGLDSTGTPRSNVIVVSDHGMAPFHTAVSLQTLLTNTGIGASDIIIRTTGPAAHVYVRLQGRESNGTVAPANYQALVSQIATALTTAKDFNTTYNATNANLFTDVFTRPATCGGPAPGFCTSADVGQDSGDVVALMAEGYNFDGTQSPGVARQGDPAFVAGTTAFSLPNFYGAHGHRSTLPSMSAIFFAAGPNIKPGITVPLINNIDIAPTILEILGVTPAPTVNGASLGGASGILR